MRTWATLGGLLIPQQIYHLELIIEEQEVPVALIKYGLHQIRGLLIGDAFSFNECLIFFVLHGLGVVGHVHLLFRRNLVHDCFVAAYQDIVWIEAVKLRVIDISKVAIRPLELKHLFATNDVPNDDKIFHLEGGADQFSVHGPINI